MGTNILNVWSRVGNRLLKHCGFRRTFSLCQPCQDLPKGVACQSAKCVRARQEPGRITSPAWPGAPSCPWTTAQLWTGNKKWEIQLQTYSSPQLDQRFFFFPFSYIKWVNRPWNRPQIFLKLYPVFQYINNILSVGRGGVWRLAWQHPWETELAATRSSC